MARTTPSLPHMIAWALCLRGLWLGVARAEVRLQATKGNSIVIFPGEYHPNAGTNASIRIKGNQLSLRRRPSSPDLRASRYSTPVTRAPNTFVTHALEHPATRASRRVWLPR